MERRMKTALDLLKNDHDTVRDLLAELADTTERATKTRGELLEAIATELKVHTTIEEEIFYPALEGAARNKSQKRMLAEAYEEHRAVEDLVMPDLRETAVNTVEFGGRAKVLKELVEHHADEEEEDMFPLAEELLSRDKLHELREQMMARKQQLLREKREDKAA